MDNDFVGELNILPHLANEFVACFNDIGSCCCFCENYEGSFTHLILVYKHLLLPTRGLAMARTPAWTSTSLPFFLRHTYINLQPGFTCTLQRCAATGHKRWSFLPSAGVVAATAVAVGAGSGAQLVPLHSSLVHDTLTKICECRTHYPLVLQCSFQATFGMGCSCWGATARRTVGVRRPPTPRKGSGLMLSGRKPMMMRISNQSE
jgi:hypothetical protein